MENHQKINCTVETCEFNNSDIRRCELHQINVKACPGCSNGNPEEESMCGSYKPKC